MLRELAEMDRKIGTISLIVCSILTGQTYRRVGIHWTALGATWGGMRMEIRFSRKGRTPRLMLYHDSHKCKGAIVDMRI